MIIVCIYTHCCFIFLYSFIYSWIMAPTSAYHIIVKEDSLSSYSLTSHLWPLRLSEVAKYFGSPTFVKGKKENENLILIIRSISVLLNRNCSCYHYSNLNPFQQELSYRSTGYNCSVWVDKCRVYSSQKVTTFWEQLIKLWDIIKLWNIAIGSEVFSFHFVTYKTIRIPIEFVSNPYY